MAVFVFCLDIFYERCENIMARCIASSAREEIGLKCGIDDFQQGPMPEFFVKAALETDLTDSSTANKADEVAEHVHCRADVVVPGRALAQPW